MRNAGPPDGPARHLRAVGVGARPAGSAAEAAARAYAAGVLRAAGYAVTEVPFTYSDAPGRLGTPAVGAWAALVLGTTAVAGARGRAGLAAAALAVGALTLVAAGGWVARVGTVRLGWRRRTAINVAATRRAPASGDTLPGAGVRVWLVGHLDTKSQPVPMVARVGGVVATVGMTGVAALAAAVGVAAGPNVIGPSTWAAIGALGVLATIPIVATTVGTDSAGALDNASGVAAVLGAAESLAGGPGSVGVLLTSAEELGLAGAHAWAEMWARTGRAPGIAFNCDGVDDGGPLTVLRGARVTTEMAGALEAADVDASVRVRRIPPGLLVDAVALTAAGWAAVTVSKGTWGTLARVHTRRDTLAHLRGDGVAAAAELLARLARAVIDPGARSSSVGPA